MTVPTKAKKKATKRAVAKPKADDMSVLRAQILACFCVPEPTGTHDMKDRCVMAGPVARFVSGVQKPETPDEFVQIDRAYREVVAEAERMVAEGILDRPHPHLMDHHEAPRDTYILTQIGVSQALAVLATSKAAGRA